MYVCTCWKPFCKIKSPWCSNPSLKYHMISLFNRSSFLFTVLFLQRVLIQSWSLELKMGQKNTKQRESMQSNLKANCLEISQKCDLPTMFFFFFYCFKNALSSTFSFNLEFEWLWPRPFSQKKYFLQCCDLTRFFFQKTVCL